MTRQNTARVPRKPKHWQSRAALRTIMPGADTRCTHCGERLKFAAKQRHKRQVICNVYRRGVWLSMQHYHEACYVAAGQPYGEPDSSHVNGLQVGQLSSQS